MGLPLWVKPARLGSSVGISKVEEIAKLDEAVELAAKHDPRVIIEASAEAYLNAVNAITTRRDRNEPREVIGRPGAGA